MLAQCELIVNLCPCVCGEIIYIVAIYVLANLSVFAYRSVSGTCRATVSCSRLGVELYVVGTGCEGDFLIAEALVG